MISNFIGSLTSTGMLRVSLKHNMDFDLDFISYYDSIRLILKPKPLDKSLYEKSPMTLYMPRSVLRGVFPDYAIIATGYTRNCRSIQLRFILDSDRETYSCLLKRVPSTYIESRTLHSLKKDQEQGYE